MAIGPWQTRIPVLDRLTMKIEIFNIKFDPVQLSYLSDQPFELAVASALRADALIRCGNKNFHLSDVALLPFYLNLRAALTDAMMREVTSHVRHDFEEVLTFVPCSEGCLASEPRPPYPSDSTSLAAEELNFKAARSLIGDLENQMRTSLQSHRPIIFSNFEVTQSPALFELLKAIDKSAEVQSE
jgi:hypothetical protein